jgi:hypothetical protein
LDSAHCTCSWRLRPEQEFIDYCSDEWKLKFKSFGHAYMSLGMKEPILQMGLIKLYQEMSMISPSWLD